MNTQEFAEKVLTIKEPRALVHVLKKLGNFSNQKQEFKALLNGPFSVEHQTLGWIYVLHGSLGEVKSNTQWFVSKVQDLIFKGDHGQIQCAPSRFCDIVSVFTRVFISQNQALSAIRPITHAVKALKKGSQFLTGLHHELIKVCMKARCYHLALPTLDEDILFLPPNDNGVAKFNVLHILCYYYYGGMTYCALKKYDRAFEFFSVAMCVPADVVSAVMVEAYKKYVLVSLILHGKFIDLPRFAPFVIRQIKNSSQPYQDLINAFETNDVDQFRQKIAKFYQTLSADNNLGLAKQCAATITRKNIKRLTETFLTLSLSSIAERVRLADAKAAETALVQMINDGEIHATIDQFSGTVFFHDDDEQFDSEEAVQLLKAEVHATAHLFEKIRSVDVELRTAPKYIKKQMQLPTDSGSSTQMMDMMDFDTG